MKIDIPTRHILSLCRLRSSEEPIAQITISRVFNVAIRGAVRACPLAYKCRYIFYINVWVISLHHLNNILNIHIGFTCFAWDVSSSICWIGLLLIRLLTTFTTFFYVDKFTLRFFVYVKTTLFINRDESPHQIVNLYLLHSDESAVATSWFT